MRALRSTFLTGILFASLYSFAAPVNESQPYGRVCVSVVQAGAETGEELFRPDAKPGPGKAIHAYLEANLPCRAVVVAFNEKNGQLTHGWLPILVDLPMWEQVKVPKAGDNWEWADRPEPFAIYVLFLAERSPRSQEVKKLVDAMRSPTASADLLQAQMRKLREMITGVAAAQAESARGAKTQPELVGGVFRGSEFPWRQYARSVNFTEDHPGLLVFSTIRSSSTAQPKEPEPPKEKPVEKK